MLELGALFITDVMYYTYFILRYTKTNNEKSLLEILFCLLLLFMLRKYCTR